jgi:hypothetical protein
MTGNNSSGSDGTFMQLIQHLEHLIADIPTEELTLALVDSNEDQLKSWYNAMMDVLKRCEMMLAGPFMSLLSSHLSADSSLEVSRRELSIATRDFTFLKVRAQLHPNHP